MYYKDVFDPTDHATFLTAEREDAALRRQRPAKRLCVLAQFDENGIIEVWDEWGTRPSSLLKLGIPGDVEDPPYALAIRDNAGRWQFDTSCHPALREMANAYIAEKFPIGS